MGRGCTMDEWVHFEKLPSAGRVPNSSYWYVHCRHCALAFEQKTLVNPPARLTGRRTSMRAHLKTCPIFGARYKLELAQKAAQQQQVPLALTVAANATAVVDGDADSAAVDEDSAPVDAAVGATPVEVPTTVPVVIEAEKKRKRKIDPSEVIGPRGGRGKHCMMEEWEHFTRLQDDGYIGNTNFFPAICKHCQRAYDEAPADKKPTLVPERMVGRREKLRKHLSLCPNFKGELPSIERRVMVRNSAQLAFLPGSQSTAAGAVGGVAPGTTASPAAATIVTATGVKQTDGNSRLALDEWQYFTRLDRKKDSAYYFARCNFCQTAFENAPEALKSSMEPVVVIGRKANMQTHLSKCPHVPKDMITTSSNSNKVSPLSMDASMGFSFARDDSAFPATKRMRIGTRDDSAPALDSTGLYSSLLEFTIQHRLPFEWTESTSTKKLFRVMPTPEMEALLPTADELRTQVLTETYEHILNSELLLLKEPLPAYGFSSTGETMEENQTSSNSWPLMMHITLAGSVKDDGTVPELESMLTNGKAQVPLAHIIKKHVETSLESGDATAVDEMSAITHFHGLEVARWTNAQIRHCVQVEKVVPAFVVMPYSSVFQRAVGILRARWPRITFIWDFRGLLLFCVEQLFAVDEVRSVLAALVELWNIEAVRAASLVANPFKDWQQCALFMQSLVDDGTVFTNNMELKDLVDANLARGLLERVTLLFRTFSAAYESSLESHLGLADTIRFIGVLLHAADGFAPIQRALEVVWSEMEQPLFILAQVLHPHTRLGDMTSTDLTKLSKLSDLGVTYFADLFGRKASSLRGEMTAYLHTSQTVFSPPFVSEFPVLDDYFRYLSDDYASLSMLMRFVHSLSSVRLAKREPKAATDKQVRQNEMYTADEQRKIAYVIERCHIEQIKSYDDTDDNKRLSVVDDNDDMLTRTAETVLLVWNRALQANVAAMGADLEFLHKKHASTGDFISGEAVVTVSDSSAILDQVGALPQLEHDDEVAYPSGGLRGDRAKRVALKELFKANEATI
uniref:BED-type domain-containing protein n=1 Tax=Globisporangium ultimum (strain ATCC 200006 / CBS 805.95 / DAOM BR144) TaxID=431595 RepID=K3WMZ6_GLOUD